MATRRLQHGLKKLDVTRKWVLFASTLVALSTILPWYEDLDAFGAGDLYLGITGPLFLVGLMILASAVMVISWIVLPLMGKRLPSLPVKEGALFAFLGVQDLLLLLVANSVFFHPKFGVNITLKDTRFGMIVAFLGVILMIWSGYQLYRRDRKFNERITSSEPVVRMPEVQEEHRPMRRVAPDTETSTEEKVDSQPLRMDL
jgi:hypothetical protein